LRPNGFDQVNAVHLHFSDHKKMPLFAIGHCLILHGMHGRTKQVRLFYAHCVPEMKKVLVVIRDLCTHVFATGNGNKWYRTALCLNRGNKDTFTFFFAILLRGLRHDGQTAKNVSSSEERPF
jgi:hypothetical protein